MGTNSEPLNTRPKELVKRLGFALLIAAAVVGVCVGCKKKDTKPAPNIAAFDDAPAEIKDVWTLALEADKTNDYYTAEVMLYDLIRRDISPAQIQTARDQLVLTHHRMQDGVDKGDPDAKAAFEKIRMAPPNRPPPAPPQ